MTRMIKAILFALVLAFSGVGAAWAAYPEKPVQIIVPSGAGGDTDIYARAVARFLPKYLKQQAVVTNIVGGGTAIGNRKGKDSPPDGYTTVFMHPTFLLINIFKVIDFGLDDFELGPIVLEDQSNAFVVQYTSRFKNLKDLAAEIKAKPGTVNFATDVGSFSNMQMAAFEYLVGGKFNAATVGGTAAKHTALKGGHIEVSGVPASSIQGFIKSKDFRVLAVASAARLPFMEDIPTFKEEGFDLVLEKPYFFLFPKNTPKDVIKTFADAVRKVTEDKEFISVLEKFLMKPSYMDPENANVYVRKVDAKLRKIHAEAGL